MSLFDDFKETLFKKDGSAFQAAFALRDKESEQPEEIRVTSNGEIPLKKHDVFMRDMKDGSLLNYIVVSDPKKTGVYTYVYAKPFIGGTTVNILGTEYTITVKKYDEDEVFARRSIDGYCDSWTKQIVVCDMSTYKGWEHESPKTIVAAQKETLRHEIVHAFLIESGLGDSANAVDCGWAKNEEMVDWFALQGPKIWKAWQEAVAV